MKNPTHYRTTTASPVGELTLIADDEGLIAIMWGAADPTAKNPVAAQLGNEFVDVLPQEHQVLAAAVEQLGEYFVGTRTDFELPLSPRGTEFQHDAWSALRTIPYGETISYGEQARRLGDRNKARAVGVANGKNPIPIVVPCHRVMGANGHLTGFAGGVEVKAWLLDHERAVLADAG